MLNPEDIKQIGEEVGKVIEQKVIKQIGEVIEQNVAPMFEDLIGRSDRTEGRIDKIEGRLDHIEATMVTKAYLDDKLADLEGSVIVRERKQDKKMQMLVGFLKDNNALNDVQVKELNEITIFPKLT